MDEDAQARYILRGKFDLSMVTRSAAQQQPPLDYYLEAPHLRPVPESYNAYRGLADLRLCRGDHDGARAAVKAMRALDPIHARFHCSPSRWMQK